MKVRRRKEERKEENRKNGRQKEKWNKRGLSKLNFEQNGKGDR
jgi:hypothetical protein